MNNITDYEDLDSPVKKVRLRLQVDLFPKIKEKKLELPSIIPRQIDNSYIENKINLRRKLISLENICQSIYTSSNTMNNTKTMEDIINDSKLKAIDDIKNDYFINQNPIKTPGNKDIYKKVILNKIKPRSIKRIRVKRDIDFNPFEEKFEFITKSVERNKNENLIYNHYSIDNNMREKNAYYFFDFPSNKSLAKHPRIYILSNKREKTIGKLPEINRENKRFHIIDKMNKLIPDKVELTREEKMNRYDEYMRAKELKKS